MPSIHGLTAAALACFYSVSMASPTGPKMPSLSKMDFHATTTSNSSGHADLEARGTNKDAGCKPGFWKDAWGLDTDNALVVIGLDNNDLLHPDPKNLYLGCAALEYKGGENYYLDCGSKPYGEKWNTFPNSALFPIEIHPGNTCYVKVGSDEFDNTWIRWNPNDSENGGFINVPNECSKRGLFGKGRRCAIPMDLLFKGRLEARPKKYGGC
ncbi:hypothetical protein PG990_008824 [Apiospora arundinis]